MLIEVVWWRFEHRSNDLPQPYDGFLEIARGLSDISFSYQSIRQQGCMYRVGKLTSFSFTAAHCDLDLSSLLQIDAQAPQPFDISLHHTYQTKAFYFFPGPNDVLLQQLVWLEFQFQPCRRRVLRQSGTQTRAVSIRGCELYTSLIKIRDSAMTGPLALMPQRGFAAHSSVIVHFEIIA